MPLPGRTLLAALAAGLALAAACRRADVTEVPNDIPADWSRQPAAVDMARSSIQAIVTPQRVRAGASFAITINTLGSGSCTRADGDRVETRDLLAEVSPFNWEAPAGTACTRDLRLFPHEVTLRFDRAGYATIRVHARDARDPQGAPVTYDLMVQVDP